mmetsp:Transcript_90046/g.226561  ORF Transcript_90046/g.226561 Transcript_90046/m.226561 type:complete len:385 (+) Transcript_90046:26-1180(+)
MGDTKSEMEGHSLTARAFDCDVDEEELAAQERESAAGLTQKTFIRSASRLGTRGWVVLFLVVVIALTLLLIRPTSMVSVPGPAMEVNLNIVHHSHRRHHKHHAHVRRRRRRSAFYITEDNHHLRCPGSISMKGHGILSLLNAGDVAENGTFGVNVTDKQQISARMGGRTYLAESCGHGLVHHTQYAAIKFMGKSLQWTVDVSAAKCGCNAAFYLVAMHQNRFVGKCHDFYCDANQVCGVHCAEVDLMEANQHAFRSTLHSKFDGAGKAGGFGGGLRSFMPGQYKPNGRCIDTRRPFHVRVHIVEHGMIVKLFQFKHCLLHYKVKGYSKMGPVREALRHGMTPVMSYWNSPDMGWLDGGVCKKEHIKSCGETVKLWSLKVIDFKK